MENRREKERDINLEAIKRREGERERERGERQ
jgi:hypothetical protein